jgi:hypothetical protein
VDRGLAALEQRETVLRTLGEQLWELCCFRDV